MEDILNITDIQVFGFANVKLIFIKERKDKKKIYF